MRFENDVELYRTIGANIKNYRRKSNISQAKLAEDVGISLSYISKIEASGCDKSVSVSVLNQIANALGIEIIKLFSQAGAKISFDVNFRANLWSEELAHETITKILPYVDIFFCSEETAKRTFQKKGDISEYEYTSTIKSITNSLKAFGDDIGYSADYYLGQIVTGKIVTIDELIEKIEAVTLEDVVKIAEKIKLQMIYFLTAESEAEPE